MLIKHLSVQGLLSFGPSGLELPLDNLNVLIGPNGSGKSNLLEVLALLKAAPTNLPQPIKEMGGVREWLWKGSGSLQTAIVEAILDNPLKREMPVRHGVCITENGGRFEVFDEWIENEKPWPGKDDPYFFYRFQRGNPVLNEFDVDERRLHRENVRPEESILSQLRDPDRYPVLSWLQEQYEAIRLFRTWSFGPTATLRREQSTHGRSDFLVDGGENLALVLSNILPRIKAELLESLSKLFDGIEDVYLTISGGNVLLFIGERGGRSIPATRLSDGTLRYLCLMAILLHPDPPPLIALEEPELGLHPDVIPYIAELLVRASQRTQLIVTTHSSVLIDALTEHPSAVIVCERENGQSRFERLSPDALAEWLRKYSLGTLWNMGELGGNRW